MFSYRCHDESAGLTPLHRWPNHAKQTRSLCSRNTAARVRLFVQPLDPAYLRILLRTVPGKSVYVSEKRESSTSTLSAHQRRTNGEHRISRQIELSLAEKNSITRKRQTGPFLSRETRPIRRPKQRPRVRLYSSAFKSCVPDLTMMRLGSLRRTFTKSHIEPNERRPTASVGTLEYSLVKEEAHQ